MPTPNSLLQEFFSQFNFQGYTYDPHRPAPEEFEYLCQARQWGPSKIREHEAAFLLAVERELDLKRSLASPNAPLQQFFSQFNFQEYTYDPHTPALEEFNPLYQVRRWGASEISEHEPAFLLATEREKDLRESLAAPNAPLQDFFSQFNFQRYTYDPHKPALEEFKRLCQARQWGPSKIRGYETAFMLAVEREKELKGSLAGPNLSLQEFFSQFNFQGYTYDPHKPPLEEFKRLCQARQWGALKIREHETAFLHAVEREQDLRGSLPGPNVVEFFTRYGYPLFTYNIDAPAQSEFQRLVRLRGWGEANISQVVEHFNKAVALDAREKSIYSAREPTDPEDSGTQEVDLLADWLRKQECPGYKYQEGLPELEFKELIRVKRREWNQVRREAGMDTRNKAWKDSKEFKQLRTEFYEIVEEAFNLLLNRFCQISGFEPWQALVGLYGQGQESVWLYNQGLESVGLHVQGLGSMGKEAARKVLQNVFINIFDFLDVFQKILRDPPTTDRWELLQLLRPLAIELQFPNNLMLGVYSALAHRVFPFNIAREDGTLVLLLHRIRVFVNGFSPLMKDFEKEAGDALQEAEEEGRVGIRRLLLSREWACLHPLKAKQLDFPF